MMKKAKETTETEGKKPRRKNSLFQTVDGQPLANPADEAVVLSHMGNNSGIHFCPFVPKSPDEALRELGIKFDRDKLKWGPHEADSRRLEPTEEYLKEVAGIRYKYILGKCMVLLENSLRIAEQYNGLHYIIVNSRSLNMSFNNKTTVRNIRNKLEALGVVARVSDKYVLPKFLGKYKEVNGDKVRLHHKYGAMYAFGTPRVYYMDTELAKKYLRLFKKLGAQDSEEYKAYYEETYVKKPHTEEEVSGELGEEATKKLKERISKAGLGKNVCRIKLGDGLSRNTARDLAFMAIPQLEELDGLVKEVNRLSGRNEFKFRLNVEVSKARNITGFSTRPYSKASLYRKTDRWMYLKDILGTNDIGELDMKASIFNLTKAMKIDKGEIDLDRDLYAEMIQDLLDMTPDPAEKKQMRNNMKLIALREQFSGFGDGMVNNAYNGSEGGLDMLESPVSGKKMEKDYKKRVVASLFDRVRNTVGEGSRSTMIFATEALVYMSVLRDLLKSGQKGTLVFDCFYYDRKKTDPAEIKQKVKDYCKIYYEKYYRQ